MKVSIWKVVFGLVLVALLVGAGGAIYRAGYARGVMSDMSFEDMPFADGNFKDGDFEGMMPYGGMRGMRGYYSYGHFSFGRMLFGGLIFFLIVGGLFRLFGGCGMRRRYGYGMPPWAMHKMHRDGKGGPPWMHHDHPYWGKHPEDDGEDEAEEESEA
jgi:hypothetical protein